MDGVDPSRSQLAAYPLRLHLGDQTSSVIFVSVYLYVLPRHRFDRHRPVSVRDHHAHRLVLTQTMNSSAFTDDTFLRDAPARSDEALEAKIGHRRR